MYESLQQIMTLLGFNTVYYFAPKFHMIWVLTIITFSVLNFVIIDKRFESKSFKTNSFDNKRVSI